MKIKKINSLHEITKGVYILSFARDFSFIPGQVIGISLDKNTPPRLYSIASSDKDQEVKILFDEKADGVLTPWLSDRKAGDKIFITEASGNFHCEKNEKAYWIAAGTGIAPFLSMYLSGFNKNKILIHGGRTRDSFYFHEVFSRLRDKYIRCCSQEKGPGLYSGRLTSYLRNMNSFQKDYKYYLCGSAEMVVETRDILLGGGIHYEQIVGEIYF